MSLTYKFPSYQSIYDALVSVQVPFNSIVSVLRDSDLNMDDDLFGESLIYESDQAKAVTGGQVATFTVPTTSQYITNSSQNLYDVALMTLGDLNKFVLLISNDENFDSINEAPNGVKTVIYSVADITDSGFKLALKKSNINITTGNIVADVIRGYLQQEDLFYILQEDGFKIQL